MQQKEDKLHNMTEERANFGSKLGVILATAGSAVGLGNVWRFPYMTGQNGGAAFILVYLACILLLGIPCMVSEFIIGILICVTLGMILYIVLFELIPHILHGQNKKLSIIGILIGVLVIVCSSFFE